MDSASGDFAAAHTADGPRNRRFRLYVRTAVAGAFRLRGSADPADRSSGIYFRTEAHLPDVLTGWYGGIFTIFPFAFQMVLILVTGYALASSKPISATLKRIAAIPKTPRGAVALTVLVALTTVTLNWGFGLITSAIFAREIAKRHRLDFAWLLAGAYTGFVMFPPGLSSSIALAQATPGSPLNIVQKLTGQIIPLHQTLLSPFNLVPSLILFIVLPLLFSRMQPPDADMQPADQARLEAEDAPKIQVRTGGLAGVLDRAWILNLLWWPRLSAIWACRWRQENSVSTSTR